MRKVETRTYDDGRTVYRVRFRHGVSPDTGRPSQTSETFTVKADAVQFAKWLDALGSQAALDRLYATEQERSIPVLDDVAAAHIELLTGVEDGTRLGYTRLWSRTWSPLLGQLRADQVGADDVRRAVNTLATRYSTKSLENQRGLLSGVLNRCIEQGHLTRNPTKGIRLPEGRRVDVDADDEDDDTEMVILTLDGFTALFDAFHPHYRALLRFLVGTGCRWGEAIVLRVKDFDLANRTVRIRRALKWSGDGKRVIGPPKTKKGRRTIVLPAEVVDDVRPLLSGRAAVDLVFTAPRGGMISHRTFWSKNWRPAIWRAQHCPDHTPAGCRCGTGEPHRCRIHKSPPPPCRCPGTLLETPRIHDMRHTHASWLLAAGVPIHVVQARLGHESIQTTIDTYGHLLPDAQLLAAQAASAAFGGQVSAITTIRPEALPDAALLELAAATTAELDRRGLPLELEAATTAA